MALRRNAGFCKKLLTTCKSEYCSSAAQSELYVPITEVKSFIARCMTKVGTKQNHAKELSCALAEADYRGHFSHGLNRLDMYVQDVESGTTYIKGDPLIAKETSATALVDGNNVLGPVVGKFSMQTAIQKARDVGVGWVVAKESNHFGIAGWYSTMALSEGLLGLAFTNSSPLVVPTRARKTILGTNPISLAAPAKNGDSFVLDMATSAVALGKVELADVKHNQIPSGWGADSEGKVSTNPAEVLNGGGLLPLGGAEITGGYKGYGLAMLVEVFCGILANANYASKIRNWKTKDAIAHLGHCFIAVNPEAFAPDFTDRMQDLINICRGQAPMEGETEVLIPGDPERKHMAKVDQSGGIPYHPNVINILNKLAKRLDVQPIKTN